MAGSLLVGPPSRADEAKQEQAKLQGTWIIVKLVEDGMEQKAEGLKCVITADTLAFQSGKRKGNAYTFKIDPKARPKTIDLRRPKSDTLRGIYELNGGRLKLCLADGGARRPHAFKGTRDWNLILLQREQ